MNKLAGLALLGVLAGTAEAKPKLPLITKHVVTKEGARFQVTNPLKVGIFFRFECTDVFSQRWMWIRPRTKRTFVITAGVPIEKGCFLVWEKAKKS